MAKGEGGDRENCEKVCRLKEIEVDENERSREVCKKWGCKAQAPSVAKDGGEKERECAEDEEPVMASFDSLDGKAGQKNCVKKQISFKHLLSSKIRKN